MKVLLVLVTLLTCGSCLMNTFPTKKSKILMLLPMGSSSHRNIFMPLAQALADKGHEITILSGLPPKAKHPQIVEINHGIDFMEDVDMFKSRESTKSAGLELFQTLLPKLAREVFDVPEVSKLYREKDQFDLVIIDHLFNEFAYPFLHEKTWIFLSTSDVLPASSANLGNPIHPAYVPYVISTNDCGNFFERWLSLFQHIFFPFCWRNWLVVPLVQEEISKRFPNLPPLLDIERNFSMVLTNTHFSIGTVLPLLPSQIEVGGMHIQTAKPLPEDLKKWIDESGPEGVIYFSLGSVAKGTTMPKKYRDVFIAAFTKLKQKVIWKFEEKIDNLPSNILVKIWLPQQDILAHPKVKVFITHGGILSLQESVYHGTPLLVIPIFGDQPKNAKMVEDKKFGRAAVWEELTANSLIEIIEDIIKNPVYSETIKSTSTLFRDKPATAIETAVWWTEYVIRHKGAPKLQSPAKDLTWIQFLYLDLLAGILLIFFILFWSIKKCFRSLCHSDKPKSKTITTKKKKQ